MTVGGLFAGIGGFELAAQWAGLTPVWSNEIDPFCCRVLRKNFDHEVIEGDIRKIGKHNLKPVDIITGGDPCQPHSVAGLGRGTKDVRYLWPEIGYTCQPYCIPAEAVGALHQRERVWLVAYNSDFDGALRQSRELYKKEETEITLETQRHEVRKSWESVDLWITDSDSDSKRLQKQYVATKPENSEEGLSRYFGFGVNPHGHITRDVLESGIIRMLNGLPEGMDYADRSKRIKGTGNAIVPEVVVEIFKAIKKINDSGLHI